MSQVPQYLSTSNKPEQFQRLINETLYILDKFGVPLEGVRQRPIERIAMAFLAVANVRQSSDWKKVDSSHALRTRDIIRYWNNYFHENISESSYDDIRRKDLKLIVLAKIINASIDALVAISSLVFCLIQCFICCVNQSLYRTIVRRENCSNAKAEGDIFIY